MWTGPPVLAASGTGVPSVFPARAQCTRPQLRSLTDMHKTPRRGSIISDRDRDTRAGSDHGHNGRGGDRVAFRL
jgi:hypothetical protein